MNITFGPDLTYFLYSLGLGVFLAIIYDIFRIIRKISKTKDLTVNIQDFIFVLFAGFLFVVLAYFVNNGRLRFYSVISAAAAFFIYRFFIGNKIIMPLSSFFGAIIGFFKKVLTVVFKGVRSVLKGLISPFRILWRKVSH